MEDVRLNEGNHVYVLSSGSSQPVDGEWWFQVAIEGDPAYEPTRRRLTWDGGRWNGPAIRGSARTTASATRVSTSVTLVRR